MSMLLKIIGSYGIKGCCEDERLGDRVFGMVFLVIGQWLEVGDWVNG